MIDLLKTTECSIFAAATAYLTVAVRSLPVMTSRNVNPYHQINGRKKGRTLRNVHPKMFLPCAVFALLKRNNI